MKTLILGHARHGKDTVAEMIHKISGLCFKSSSFACSEIFIYEELKDKFGYKSKEECFEDRHNHRELWHNMIANYNTPDKARLAKEILKDSDIYVGMRSNEEFQKCKEDRVFDIVIGVFNPDKPLEGKESFNIDFWNACDFIIINNGTLEELEGKVMKLCKIL